MKVTRTEDGVFHLTAETMADAELVDCIDMDGTDAIALEALERSPYVGGGHRTTGVSLAVGRNHPRALEAQSARQFLRAVRELFRLGLGEDAFHSHIGLDAPQSTHARKAGRRFQTAPARAGDRGGFGRATETRAARSGQHPWQTLR